MMTGEEIRKMRQQLCMSLRAFVDHIGLPCSVNTLRSIEAGEHVSNWTMSNVAASIVRHGLQASPKATPKASPKIEVPKPNQSDGLAVVRMFENWLAGAAPGERYEYARAPHLDIEHAAIAQAAYAEAIAGRVILFQRRLDKKMFVYLAQKASGTCPEVLRPYRGLSGALHQKPAVGYLE